MQSAQEYVRVCKSCTIGTLHQITDASRLVSERVNSIHVLHRNTNRVTIPACDVLLHHFRTMLLYVRRYTVAYSYLLCTLGISNTQFQCRRY